MLSACRQAAGGLLQQADHLLAAAARVAPLLPNQLQRVKNIPCTPPASQHPAPAGRPDQGRALQACTPAWSSIGVASSSDSLCRCGRQQPHHTCSGNSSRSSNSSSLQSSEGCSVSHALATSSSSSSSSGSSSRQQNLLSRRLQSASLTAATQQWRTLTASSRPAAAAKAQAPDALAPADSSSSSAVVGPASSSPEAAAGEYQRSRFKQFYEQHAARELLLKANIRNPHHVPRIRQVHAIISANDVVGKSLAEKWRLLLPALALEYITGQPAQYATSTNKYYSKRNLVTGVHVSLSGRDAYDFLEKLVTLVLPSQNAFDGIMLKTLDKQHHVHFKVANMGNFPDFEDQYEMFEALRVMHVTITMDGVAKSPAYTQMLLTSLGLPLLRRMKVVGGVDEAFGDPAPPAAAAGGAEGLASSGEDGDEDVSGSSSDDE